MKLSIIIPVYNTEKYLVRCLDSVFFQDLLIDDYEVIVINDGSVDNSLAILKEYEAKYSNMILVNQENKGEATTRNKALKMARGKYITFVDSDDAIEINTLKVIIEKVEANKLDILYLKINLYDENGNWLEELPNIGSDTIILKGVQHERRPFPATLYLKTLIAEILFPTNVLIGPDSVFNAMVQSKAMRCSYLSKPYYKYTYRLNSLSKQGATEKAYIGFKNALVKLAQFEEETSGHTIEEKNFFDKMYHIFITRIVELNILPQLDKYKYKELKTVLKEIARLDLMVGQDSKYPHFSTNFTMFKLVQQWLRLKSKIYYLIKSS